MFADISFPISSYQVFTYKVPNNLKNGLLAHYPFCGDATDKSPNLRDGGSWQFTYMYYLGLIIGGGTSQIQKNIISERGLGMPREPKTQQGV